MAATDVKDIFVKQETNGEQWLYKRLCNGDEIPIMRLCNCEGDPDDPGTGPDPIDASVCHVANGMARSIQAAGERLAQLMTEQPNNQFGDLAAAVIWMDEIYNCPAGFCDPAPIAQIVADFSANETDIYAGMQEAGMVDLLICALYAAISADTNGIELSPSIGDIVSVGIGEIEIDPPDAELEAARPFIAALAAAVRFSQYKRWAYAASIIDPAEEPGYSDCTECGSGSGGGTACSGVHWIWNQVDATPAGFSVPTGTPNTLIPHFRNWMIDLGATEELVDGYENNVTRVAFDHWKCPADVHPVNYFMMLVYEFAEPCTLEQAHMRVATGTDNSKRAGIYYQLDGETDPEDWHEYALAFTGWQGGFLQTGSSLLVNNVARLAFVGAYGGGQLYMNETAINASLV